MSPLLAKRSTSTDPIREEFHFPALSGDGNEYHNCFLAMVTERVTQVPAFQIVQECE
jgi:hypothetical protein